MPARPPLLDSIRELTEERARMATVDETRQQVTTNGAGDGRTIAVENPATGETIAHVPDLDEGQVAELANRGRAAQPGWDALGFQGRADVMLAMRTWLVRNRERMTQT